MKFYFLQQKKNSFLNQILFSRIIKNYNKMKIEWAPLKIPMRRRIETLVTGLFMSWIFFGELFSIFIIAFFLYTGNFLIRTIVIGYLIFVYHDRHAGTNGSRRNGSEWVRNWKIWEYYNSYFPAKIHKTVDLPADRNYLFAAFPHGLISLAAFASFGTNASSWRELFPGIRTKLATLDFHFYVPIFREVILSWGLGSVSAESIRNMLTVPNNKNHPFNDDGYTSNVAIIIVGGAQEALNCRPNNYAIILKNRKGFIRMAMTTGVPVVPVMSFGEVDLFDQPPNPPGSLLRRYQEFVKRVTGIAPAAFIGRGLFQYTYGIIPRRHPINTVIGAPIEVPKSEQPTREDVDKYHAVFCEALNDLFETHKSKYIKDYENVKLVIE